jgi:alpha-galactosidase
MCLRPRSMHLVPPNSWRKNRIPSHPDRQWLWFYTTKNRTAMTRLFLVPATCLVCLVHGLDNGLALKPLLGWNTWCALGPCGTDICNQSQVMESIDALVQNGMQKAGYNYVTLDDCFAMHRDNVTNELYPHPEWFPQGFKPVIDYAHSKGFKFGIYTSAGATTCHYKKHDCNGQCDIGSLGHYEQDARTFAKWKLDFVKMDWCGISSEQKLNCETQYGQMAKAINATGRPMYFYMSCGPGGRKKTWAPKVANTWRIGNDSNSIHVLHTFGAHLD